ncbi:tol-pal system YbgF family protein [Thermodesulfobacteriota bacterium]
MAKKRVPRKELLKTEDEFITFSSRLLQNIIRYKLQVLCAIGGVFLLVVIFSGVRYFSIQKENEAFAQMEESFFKYQNALNKNKTAESYDIFQADFQRILDKYSGTKGGKLARVIFANMCYNAGNYDRAVALYHKALKDFDDSMSIKGFILSGLGYAYEGKKDYPTAAKFFEEIVSSPEAVMKDEALFNLGRIYASMGEADKSITSYNKIVSEYTGSIYHSLAKEKLSG